MSYKEEIKQNIINISTVRKNKKISKSDINALFLGLANIVKKSAVDEVSTELKRQCHEAQENFTSALKDLTATEMQLKSVVAENELLYKKIDSLRQQICTLLASKNVVL